MLVYCVIAIAIKYGTINLITTATVKGKLLNEGQSKYLVDFSKDLSQYNLSGKPEDYKSVLVEKDQCVKE